MDLLLFHHISAMWELCITQYELLASRDCKPTAFFLGEYYSLQEQRKEQELRLMWPGKFHAQQLPNVTAPLWYRSRRSDQEEKKIQHTRIFSSQDTHTFIFLLPPCFSSLISWSNSGHIVILTEAWPGSVLMFTLHSCYFSPWSVLLNIVLCRIQWGNSREC